jgi:hypothetical protein
MASVIRLNDEDMLDIITLEQTYTLWMDPVR